jgi:hypothetical protein
MDQHFDQFSKSLGELVPRRESPQGATAMIHRAICLLAYVVAVSGIVGVAQAGQITYDFVNPITGTNGYDLRGSITVDSTGISAAPIDLTTSMIQSWHISVFDSANVLQFSLASTSDILLLTDNSSFHFAPRISLSSLFLPVLAISGSEVDLSEIFLTDFLSSSKFILWANETANLQFARIAQAQSAPPTKHLFDTFDDSQTIFTIAVAEPASTAIPEPSSLVIAMTLFGCLGLAGVWRRSRHRQPVTESADQAGCGCIR